MTNIIQFKAPPKPQTAQQRLSALIENFALGRRGQDDVFWLKENAELLNILECTNTVMEVENLQPLANFYDKIEGQIEFFPQYYRFILSICLDLEDLGLNGNKAEAIADWVSNQGLAEAELSDLQRAEAQRLLRRRDCAGLGDDEGLLGRLHQFIDRSDTFALPNKKAAYELTHIVFYLSEYGRTDPQLSQAAVTSLEYAGVLAYLDQNSDLLAEVCIALQYAGEQPSQVWVDWLEQQAHYFVLSDSQGAGQNDEYHDFFVCNWLMASSGRKYFVQQVPAGPMRISQGHSCIGPLREISRTMFDLRAARSSNWQQMKPHVEAALNEDGHGILNAAMHSCRDFEGFFAGFARADSGAAC